MVYDKAVYFDQQVDQDVEGFLRIVIVKQKHVIQLHMAPVFSITGQVSKALGHAHFAADAAVELPVFDPVDRWFPFGVVLSEQSHGIFTLDDLLLRHFDNFNQSWCRSRFHKRTAGYGSLILPLSHKAEPTKEAPRQIHRSQLALDFFLCSSS